MRFLTLKRLIILLLPFKVGSSVLWLSKACRLKEEFLISDLCVMCCRLRILWRQFLSHGSFLLHDIFVASIFVRLCDLSLLLGRLLFIYTIICFSFRLLLLSFFLLIFWRLVRFLGSLTLLMRLFKHHDLLLVWLLAIHSYWLGRGCLFRRCLLLLHLIILFLHSK